MESLVSLLYGCFLSVWRMAFGSSGWDLPLIKHRAVQHIIGFLACSFVLWICGYHIVQIIACAGVLQGFFWSMSHGAVFDFGHGTVDVSRYEQLWFWKYIKKYIPENMLYEYNCDFILMTIRYTAPAILMSLILLSPIMLLAGFSVSISYALCWACYDLGWTKNPTEIAEFLSGFFTGLLLTI